jgi:hypothetical protein
MLRRCTAPPTNCFGSIFTSELGGFAFAPPRWSNRSPDLGGRSVLVRAYAPRDRVGEELRLARFIAPVARQARRCIVLAEPRLVPLLQRSFDGIEMRPRGIDDAAAFADADVAAYYETVALHASRQRRI